ncbi:MAG TPA: SMP-30/gluconolactonase/LRE family protein [Burkholderiales bacterium]|jgi:gluconolactonase|nr:SMP-30/gluconolactonase/LRE family protein [Burkholderiales bacterium]
MFAPPELIPTEVFAEVPARLRKKQPSAERLAAGKGPTPAGCFLEGPCFDRAGNLYVVDLAYGRIFRITPKGDFDVAAEYEGEPNGLAIHKDGRIFIADHKLGILALDPKSGAITAVVARYHQQAFKGVNDLIFDSQGNLLFTDQGQSDLADPSGAVYRLTADNKLEKIAGGFPSPNGLALNKAENTLFVAMTRANAVWRLPFAPDGTVVRMGVQIQLSGGRGPDGMAMDESDGLAVAHPDMGAVWLFNHRGEPTYRVQSSGSDIVTNVCHGGADRKTLYITDSGMGLILMARVPTAGRTLYSHS